MCGTTDASSHAVYMSKCGEGDYTFAVTLIVRINSVKWIEAHLLYTVNLFNGQQA